MAKNVNISYRDLAELIEKLPEDRKDDLAVVNLIAADEYLALSGWSIASEENRALDAGHFVYGG